MERKVSERKFNVIMIHAELYHKLGPIVFFVFYFVYIVGSRK